MPRFGPLHDEPTWPQGVSPPVVFLLDASSSFEHALLENWVRRHRPPDQSTEPVGIAASRRRSRRKALTRVVTERAHRGDNPTFVPLRVVWLPPEREDGRTLRITDFLRFGDLRDPDPVRARWLYRHHRDLVRIVMGAPATARELRRRWESRTAQEAPLGEFITRQAHLALERAERGVRGSRYKVARFVHEEILWRADFQQRLRSLAAETGQPLDQLRRSASRYLREIAARTNTYTVDVVANGIRWLYRRGYRDLHHDPADFAEVARLSQQFPVVYLPSHKSNFDHLVLAYLLWEHGLPPNHTAGGINMDFFPIGPILRRTGVFFIRRSFRENPVYKATLQAYLDYLIEKRFPVEWYLEGGRSRSGKLLAPRYGMLGYVADAYWRGKTEDVYLVPVSISYDQIQEVQSHAAEQRGDPKERESLGWMVRAVRSFRGRYGSIHVKLGEPLSLRKELADRVDPARKLLEIQKLAFEVLVRVGTATTVTEPSVVVSALLSWGGRSRSEPDLRKDVSGLADEVRRLGLPVAEGFSPESEEDLRANLEVLEAQGLVEVYDRGLQPVYRIADRRHHEAAYYRNTIVHYFVPGAITETAAVACSWGNGSPVERFWMKVEALRDLLKFEFFFPARLVFREQIRRELVAIEPRWEKLLDSPEQLLHRLHPLRAHWALRPWLDGYLVASEVLRGEGSLGVDREDFIRRCLAVGRQLLLQGTIAGPESVSRAIFESAWALAENRGLLDPVDPSRDARRAQLRAEIGDALAAIRIIQEVSREAS